MFLAGGQRVFMAKTVFKGSIKIVSGKVKLYIEYFGINMTIILKRI